MPTRKLIRPDDKLPLKLTAAERKLILEELLCLDEEIEQVVRDTASRQPVRLTLDDLDDLGGHVAAAANHSPNKSKGRKLDAIFGKIQDLLDRFTDEEPPRTVDIKDARAAKLIADQAAQIAEFAARALAAAEQLGIKNKVLEHFSLAPAQRDVLSSVPGVTKALQQKLAKDAAMFSVGEVASLILALAENLPDGDARQQVASMFVAQHLMDQLQGGIAAEAAPKRTRTTKGKSQAASPQLYQFKITLLDVEPPVWRRIQVRDGTLDQLHEQIQTAMGWTNSHLHQFEINGTRYGDPELLDDGFEDFECVDSTRTLISDILAGTGKRFAFQYEYDFGDGWEHEVLFEGNPPTDPKGKYPLCLEGERACPPEDCGGSWGYGDFLEAIRNPKHEEHASMLEWIGGSFDPEAFDAKQATKAMKKGLPDWRSLR